MKKLFVLSSVALMLMIGARVEALSYSFTFYGEDAGGVGSAEMDVFISGTTLTAIVNNTSPTLTIDEQEANAPGITGFGFNLVENAPSLLSWHLVADSIDAQGVVTNDVTIGGDPVPGTGEWEMGTELGIPGNIALDYLPQAVGNGQGTNVQGALYNPAADFTAFGALPNYLTTATLTMTFAGSENLELLLEEWSPYVRMQNVGYLDGERDGSLKLPGTPVDPIPEPSTVFLLGIGLLGVLGLGRKFKK